MSLGASLQLLFWLLLVWAAVGFGTGLLSVREFLTVCLMIDTVGLLTVLDSVARGHWPAIAFAPIWAYWLRRDYRRWRDSDDDHDHRKRRRSWVRSRLPKPWVKPVEATR